MRVSEGRVCVCANKEAYVQACATSIADKGGVWGRVLAVAERGRRVLCLDSGLVDVACCFERERHQPEQTPVVPPE
jgi:hypothetical protein